MLSVFSLSRAPSHSVIIKAISAGGPVIPNMKRCPQCGQTYTDDLMYCLTDGTPLTQHFPEPEQPTLVRAKKTGGVSPVFKYLTVALLLVLVLLAAGGIGLFYVFQHRAAITPANNTGTNTVSFRTPTPSSTPDQTEAQVNSNLQKQQDDLEREKQRLAEERRQLEEARRNQANTAVPEPPPASDPGRTRITFGRGRVSDTTSGTIVRSRSFVLRTLSGQRLHARVRSPEGCVEFDNGSNSISFDTAEGDSTIRLRNNCDRPIAFVLVVAVR